MDTVVEVVDSVELPEEGDMYGWSVKQALRLSAKWHALYVKGD